MADTGEDDEVTLDTTPIHGAIRYVVGREDVAPGVSIYFATDGHHVRVPAQSLQHADMLAQAITLVELEWSGSRGWLSRARRTLLWAARWLNARDWRTKEW